MKSQSKRKKEGKNQDFNADSELSELSRNWRSSSHNTDEPSKMPLDVIQVDSLIDLKPDDFILVIFSTSIRKKLIYKYVEKFYKCSLIIIKLKYTALKPQTKKIPSLLLKIIYICNT